MPPKALQNPKRRKALVYAGVAAAILLVVLLNRRQSQQQQAAGQQQPQPVSNPAIDPSSYGGGAGGIDYGAQLATIDTNLQTLSDQLAQGQQSYGSPGTSASDMASLLQAEFAAIGIYQAGQKGPGNRRHTRPQTKPRRHHHKPPSHGGGTSHGAGHHKPHPHHKPPHHTRHR